MNELSLQLERFISNDGAKALGILFLVALIVVKVLRRHSEVTVVTLLLRLMFRWSRWCAVVTEGVDQYLLFYRRRMAEPFPTPVNETFVSRPEVPSSLAEAQTTYRILPSE